MPWRLRWLALAISPSPACSIDARSRRRCKCLRRIDSPLRQWCAACPGRSNRAASPCSKKITTFRPDIWRWVRASASKPASEGRQCWSCTMRCDSWSDASMIRAALRSLVLTRVPEESVPVCAAAIRFFSGSAAASLLFATVFSVASFGRGCDRRCQCNAVGSKVLKKPETSADVEHGERKSIGGNHLENFAGDIVRVFRCRRFETIEEQCDRMLCARFARHQTKIGEFHRRTVVRNRDVFGL